MPKEVRLVPIGESAHRLGVKACTVRAWANSGRIGSVKLGSRRLIPSDEIDRIIKANFSPARADEANRID